jgi:L-asparaginase / beta-aspartyl-peptidase
VRNVLCLFTILITLANCKPKEDGEVKSKVGSQEAPAYAMVIHGGAGTITKANMTDSLENAYNEALGTALTIGEDILSKGGKSIDAVEAVIRFLEDSPLFNAGKGAVFTNEGKNELDASIMVGSTQMAGAIAGVTTIKNPISTARAVMEQSEHVMLIGKGAEQFAAEKGMEIVDPSYFFTQRRYDSLLKLKSQDTTKTQLSESEVKNGKKGTVGCVALDKNGDIVAGTSTGGMTNKKWNRVGDAPIIGAGTFADNKTCGISATGHGEYFIRYTVARDIAAMMEYGGKSIQEAADYIVNQKLVEKGGEGGIVGLDAKGNVVMVFNSEGMYRGFVKPGERVIGIYK